MHKLFRQGKCTHSTCESWLHVFTEREFMLPRLSHLAHASDIEMETFTVLRILFINK